MVNKETLCQYTQNSLSNSYNNSNKCILNNNKIKILENKEYEFYIIYIYKNIILGIIIYIIIAMYELIKNSNTYL